MNLQKILKTAVVAEWILSVPYLLSSRMLNIYLPIQLQDYKAWVNEQESTNVEVAILLIVVLLVIGHIISSIGLFFIKPWAKWSYITVFVTMGIFSTFTGPVVDHALSFAIGSLGSVFPGAILYMLFFTKVMSKEEQ